MARTKASRGVKNFSLRSGAATPYPFLGKIGKALGGGLLGKVLGKKDPGSAAAEAMGGADDVNTKIDEIHEALVGGDGGGIGSGTGEAQTLAKAAKDGVLTKKAGPLYHKPHHTDKQVDPKTGKKHYHGARYVGELEGRNPE